MTGETKTYRVGGTSPEGHRTNVIYHAINPEEAGERAANDGITIDDITEILEDEEDEYSHPGKKPRSNQ